MKKFKLIYLMIILLSNNYFAQQFYIKGKVFDKENNSLLIFANIRVLNTSFGTTSNREGVYEIKLPKGNYTLIASFMGYHSDTIHISLASDLKNKNFRLSQSEINLAEVVVSPDDNPANEIIRRAIKQKKIRNEKLKDYEFTAYTKSVVKTNQRFTAGEGSVGIGLNTDTTGMKINGILENKSSGYFKAPKNYKEIIIARKQSANLPPQVNLLTGGRIIQNFYNDDVRFFDTFFKSPIDDDALSYYKFTLSNSVSIDNQNVYEIEIKLKDTLDPGFTGKIFISEKTYDLLKVDLLLKNFPNVGGIFDSIKIFQHFYEFAKFYMPVDYHLIVQLKFLTLKLEFELNTILYDYKINQQLDDNFFDKAVVKVSTNADKLDSTFWETTQKISNTIEETEAYSRLDSVSKIKTSFWDKLHPLAHPIYVTDNFSISGLLGIYHYNRVEGHAFDYNFSLKNGYDKRFFYSLDFNYGLNDKKFKHNFNSYFLFGDYRTTKLSLNIFNRLNTLFGDASEYNEMFSTILALFFKDDFKDYYYSSGFSVNLFSEVTSVVALEFGFTNLSDKSAALNSNFSIFKKDFSFRPNFPIYNSSFNIFQAGFQIDFRNFIEDGYNRIRIGSAGSFFIFNGDLKFSKNNLLKSDLDFLTYEFQARGRLNTFNSAGLNFLLKTFYNNGKLPYQLLSPLPGNINLTSRNYTFRTLELNEIIGDRTFMLFLEHNFKNELFRLLNIDFIKKLDLQFKYFFNIAVSNISNDSKSILLYPVKNFPSPFYETGFSIGHSLIPIEINFGWKLNYRGSNDFRIGLTSLIID